MTRACLWIRCFFQFFFSTISRAEIHSDHFVFEAYESLTPITTLLLQTSTTQFSIDGWLHGTTRPTKFPMGFESCTIKRRSHIRLQLAHTPLLLFQCRKLCSVREGWVEGVGCFSVFPNRRHITGDFDLQKRCRSWEVLVVGDRW